MTFNINNKCLHKKNSDAHKIAYNRFKTFSTCALAHLMLNKSNRKETSSEHVRNLIHRSEKKAGLYAFYKMYIL